MVEFICWIILVSLGAAFLLGLLNKWKILEWLQMHAPTDFINELLRCKFCSSWWISVLISLSLAIVFGEWGLMFLPFFTTVITKELW